MIELELEALASASLSHLIPGHLVEHYKAELSDSLVASALAELDGLVGTLEAHTHLKALSLEDNYRFGDRSSVPPDSCDGGQALGELVAQMASLFGKYAAGLRSMLDVFERWSARGMIKGKSVMS